MRTFIAAHRRAVWAGAGILIAAIVFVLVWFQPQKLFINETVNEALPVASPDRDDDATPVEGDATVEPTATEPARQVLAEGPFQRLEHPTSGTAKVVQLSDGSLVLRFEDLDTSNGPDLRVYLSEVPASDDWYAYGEDFIDLGRLKGNRGDQNYAIPKDTDLSRYKSAVIWCRRFTVGFGVAPLS